MRLGSRLSQLELATRMGFPGQIVTEVERGEQAPTERYLEQLARVLELPPREIYELWEQYRHTPAAAGTGTPSAGGRLDRSDCPYRGLYAFREQDAPLYHGRAGVVARLVRAVGQSALAGVVGASGSGKSSLVHAGLIPVLRRQPQHWAVAVFRPGASPYEALAAGLVEVVHPDDSVAHNATAAAQVTERMRAGGVSQTVEQIAQRLDRPLLLFADQFEELFTHCRDEDVVHRFLDDIAGLALRHPGGTSRVKLVLTLRGDFYGRAVAHRRFSDVLQDHVVNLPPMNRGELRSAIVEPARARQLLLEDGLVERILDDVGSAPGNLPLLEFALTLLWERQSSGRLTHAAYETVGEVVGAIATRAEEVYAALSPQQQDTARQLLTRLVRVAPIGEEGEDARRRTPVAELSGFARIDEVISALTDARLLVTDSDEQGRPAVEVSHEAVIRSWGRLRVWLDGDRQFLLWQQRTRRRYDDWRAEHEDAANALHGRLLAEAEGWLRSRGAESVAADLREFIQHSVELRGAEELNGVLAELERLLTVEADELMALINRLSEHRDVIEERVRRALRGEAGLRSDPGVALSDQELFRLRLLLALGDPAEADWIVRHLDTCAPRDLVVARQVLSPLDPDRVASLWRSLLAPEGAGPSHHLRLAVLLAETAADDPRWRESAGRVAAELLAQDQLQLPTWLEALGRGAEPLLEPLTATAVDDGARDTVRETAVSLLHQVAASRGDLLAEMAAGGPEHAYQEVVRRLADAADPAVRATASATLRGVLAGEPPADLDEPGRIRFGRRRAAAACTLLRFAESDGILQRLTTAPEPEFATQFAHQALRRQVPGPLIAGMLTEAPTADARYHLLMALGSFDGGSFPDPEAFAAVRARLLDLHASDPDPGVHSATIWLDRRWGGRVGAVGHPAPYDPSGRRGWFTGTPHSTRLAFSVFRPGALLTGSPPGERERSSYESPRRDTRITRSFALGTAQVTRGAFEEFMAETGRHGLPDISEWSDKPVEPVVAPTWYESADFCEWLTTRTGTHRRATPYAADIDDHVVLGAGWGGFRLPTEAEWEYACRAGTVTAYSFGSDRDLLDEYAWTAGNSGLKTHEAGILRPNPAGLFDIHGQCWEWCSDWYALYGDGPAVDPTGPGEGDRRVLRGGCWNLGPRYARSACRNAHIPSNRNYYITFRLALTLPEPDPTWSGGPNPLSWSG